MSKPKITRFFKDFFIPNAILFVVYLVSTTAVSMFFGNATLEFATDVAAGEQQNVVLTVLYTFLQLAAFFGFYVFSLFRLERDSEEKRAFLTELGTEAFDGTEFSKKYFSEKGKYMLIYFSATLGVLSLARLIGVPFSLILIFPQSMLANVLTLVFGINAGFMSLVIFVVAIIVNIVLYFAYQRFICAKVYEKWADGRLRVN